MENKSKCCGSSVGIDPRDHGQDCKYTCDDCGKYCELQKNSGLTLSEIAADPDILGFALNGWNYGRSVLTYYEEEFSQWSVKSLAATDGVVTKRKSWEQKEPEKCIVHESDGQCYLSDPPQYKCKKCGEMFRYSDSCLFESELRDEVDNLQKENAELKEKNRELRIEMSERQESSFAHRIVESENTSLKNKLNQIREQVQVNLKTKLLCSLNAYDNADIFLPHLCKIIDEFQWREI